MTETHDYERRREIAQWYDDASGWHREINETTPKAVREAMGKLIRCARQMMLRHADEVLAACADVERLRSRVGWLDHLDTPEGRAMHATEIVQVENEDLRADLREALRLLREVWSEGAGDASWNRETFALLAKHKETP